RQEREKCEDGECRQYELRDGECHFKSLLSLRDRVAVYGGGRERTVTAIPWTPRISTSRPRAIGAVAVAASVCTAPSYVSAIVPCPRSPMHPVTVAVRS